MRHRCGERCLGHVLGLILRGLTPLGTAFLQNHEGLQEKDLCVRVFRVRGRLGLDSNNSIIDGLLLLVNESLHLRLVVGQQNHLVLAIRHGDPAESTPSQRLLAHGQAGMQAGATSHTHL